MSRKGLVDDLGICRNTLSSRFKIFFDNPMSPVGLWRVLPPKIACDESKKWVYGVDGKHLHRNGVFLIHRDVTNKENLFWSFWPSESYLALGGDLKILSKLIENNFPSGAISDWKGAIVAAVGGHFGGIPHQRCLTHVVTLGKRLLPENSPYEATRKIRVIANELTYVGTKLEMVDWMWNLEVWKQEYGPMLKNKTLGGPTTKKKWWYTHGNLRRGFNLLTHDQNPLFVYLDYPLIPKSNNSLEGVNSQAVQKLGDHRGMKISQQVAFLSWHLTFGRVKNRQDLKKLWGCWRKEFLERLPTQKPT